MAYAIGSCGTAGGDDSDQEDNCCRVSSHVSPMNRLPVDSLAAISLHCSRPHSRNCRVAAYADRCPLAAESLVYVGSPIEDGSRMGETTVGTCRVREILVRIVRVGAGPAGLYLPLLMKLREPQHEIPIRLGSWRPSNRSP